MKEIKIPKGQIKLVFENGQGFILTAKQVWDALTEYIFKGMESPKEIIKETFIEEVYDDTNPDYIKGSIED